MRRSRQSSKACANSQRHYRKKRDSGLARVSLWICRSNRHLIDQLRSIDWGRPVGVEEILSAVGALAPEPSALVRRCKRSRPLRTDASPLIDIPGQTLFGFSGERSVAIANKAEVQESSSPENIAAQSDSPSPLGTGA